jgi:putative inorganic carbon (HCO3(-)) transporter
MTGLADEVRVSPRPRADSRPLPKTRPRGRLALLLPLPVAVAAGLGAGASPHLALAVAAALVSAAVLVVRVEWAALAVIGCAVFEGYLSLVSPWATHWLVAVLVVAWLVRRVEGPLHERRLVTAAVPAAALAAALLIAVAVHPHGVAGLEACARYAELSVVMLVLADVMCGPLAPRRAVRVYVLACVAASVCGIVTAVGSERHRVEGPVPSADAFAFFLVAALPLVGTVRTRRDQPVWWIWACLAVLLVAGVGTQSRPAFVAVVAMVLVAVLTGLLALRYAGALIAVIISGLALVIAVLPLPIGQALTDPQRYSATNIAQRDEFRFAALEMTRASPVVGLGPGAFALFHEDYVSADADPRDRDLDTAYSTALEASAELGVLGLLALYAMWLVPAAAARRRWQRDRHRLSAATLLALNGLLTASLIESEQFALPLWFLAALTIAQGRPQRPRAPVFGEGSSDRSSGQVGPR